MQQDKGFSLPDDWTRVGKDGEFMLYASPDREQGVLVESRTNTVQGDPQPLQVFFKWGNFVAVE